MRLVELLASVYVEEHPHEAADLLERLAPANAALALSRVPPRVASEALRHMDMERRAACLAAFSRDDLADVLEAMPLDALASAVRRMPAAARETLLASAPEDVAVPLHRLLAHAEHTAGALMNPQVVSLPADLTVAEARRRVRRRPEHLRYYLYVVDRDDRLVGVLTLRELLAASPRAAVTSLMRTEVRRIPARSVRAEILAHPGWDELFALPVVDEGGTLLGVLRYETLQSLRHQMGDRATPPTAPISLQILELYWAAVATLLRGALEPRRVVSAPAAGKEPLHGA